MTVVWFMVFEMYVLHLFSSTFFIQLPLHSGTLDPCLSLPMLPIINTLSSCKLLVQESYLLPFSVLPLCGYNIFLVLQHKIGDVGL